MTVRSGKAQAGVPTEAGQTSSRRTGYKWRRLHDGNIIAEVTPHTGTGFWRASGYRAGGRANEVAYTGRAFVLLNEAHQGADELVQREFQHECRTGVCGRWLRWALTEED